MAITTSRAAFVLLAAVVALSCSLPPTSPTKTFAAITDVSYVHVIPFAITSDMQVNFELWSCGAGPRDGPLICPLAPIGSDTYGCLTPRYLPEQVPTNGDSVVDVMIRSATGNPLVQVAHNIYLNGFIASRVEVFPDVGYPRETASFTMDASGHIR
jgi:hypothetical protein